MEYLWNMEKPMLSSMSQPFPKLQNYNWVTINYNWINIKLKLQTWFSEEPREAGIQISAAFPVHLDFREVQDSLFASRKMLLQKKKVTFLSSSEEAEKNHVLCFLLMWTNLKGNTLLDVVSSAARITLRDRTPIQKHLHRELMLHAGHKHWHKAVSLTSFALWKTSPSPENHHRNPHLCICSTSPLLW